MRRIRLVCLAALLVVAASGVPPVAADVDEAVLIVDASGEGEYESVQAAVDAAEPGDTVRVRPGQYRERITVDTAVTIVAPDGATLNGTGFDDYAVAVEIEDDADAVVDGFTISGYTDAVKAPSTTGDWEVRNTEIRNPGWHAVNAGRSDGDWRISNITIRNTTIGINAASSTGDWTVSNTTVRNATGGHGIRASAATGNWTLDSVTVADVDKVALAAAFTEGDWSVTDSTIEDAPVGIGALEASGNWTVRGTSVVNTSVSERYDFIQPALREGVGLDARDTTGDWTVNGTRFVNNEEGDITAEGSDPAGDATGNWWGEDGHAGCTGNVDCGNALSEWPSEQFSRNSADKGTETTRSSTPTSGENTPSSTPTPSDTTPDETRSETATTTVSSPGLTLLTPGLLLAIAAVVGFRRQ